MRFAQSERARPSDLELQGPTITFHLSDDLVEDRHYVIVRVEGSPSQYKFGPNRLANPDRVGETRYFSARDHINMMAAASDVLPNEIQSGLPSFLVCHSLDSPFGQLSASRFIPEQWK